MTLLSREEMARIRERTAQLYQELTKYSKGNKRLRATVLLSGIGLMPLEEIVKNPEQLRGEILEVIEQLIDKTGLPPTDPLRYGNDGEFLPPEELSRKLQMIINSWK
jgi:uncharacterized NAD-dependent epimerase/dehydratase family protein